MIKLESLLLQPNDTLKEYVIKSSFDCQSRNQTYKAIIPNCEEEFFIKAQRYETPKEKNRIDSEIDILNQLKENHNILNHTDHIKQEFPIKLRSENGETYEFKQVFMISVMHFYKCYDLQKYYSEYVNKTNKKEINHQIFYKSLLILKDIHSKRIVHHDIKPQNFLVRNNDPFDIVLTDFEFSVQLKEHEKTNSKCGTLHLMAPEILNGDYHDMAVDIWSLGVMMYCFSRGVYPFGILPEDNMDLVRKKLIKNKRPGFGKKFNRTLGNLLIKMLEIDPKKRITVEDALKHPYFERENNLVNTE